MSTGYITLENIAVERVVQPKLHRKNYVPMIIGIVICVLLIACVIFLGVTYGSSKANRLPYINREKGEQEMNYERAQPRKIENEEWANVVVVARTGTIAIPAPAVLKQATGEKKVVAKLAEKASNNLAVLSEVTGSAATALVATGSDVIVILHSKRCPACVNLLKSLNASKDQLTGLNVTLLESSEWKDLPESDFKAALSTSAIPFIVRFKGGKSVSSKLGGMPLDVFKTFATADL